MRLSLFHPPRSFVAFARFYSTPTAIPGQVASLPDADVRRLARQRNIGISAHIDSGKTTLTERVLFYTGRLKAIHEVRGKDGVGAKMDSMELEREKGITIQSAATFCDWEAVLPKPSTGEWDPIKGTKERIAINIIDTPGHVDFTIEVERALRVLDGAVLVLCAVSGVQSQTITVMRQMRRYNVPRVAFINKMDRPGANPSRIVEQIKNKLSMPAAAVQIPIGTEDTFEGVVDLVRWKAYYNRGPKGEEVHETEIPDELIPAAKRAHVKLIEALAEVDIELSDLVLMDSPITPLDIANAIRRSTVACRFSPVFVGSAIKNTGVQPLLDGVAAYLPDPSEIEVKGYLTNSSSSTTSTSASTPPSSAAPPTTATETAVTAPALTSNQIVIPPSSTAPLLLLTFKLEESKYGQLTYVRVYSGTLKRGAVIHQARTGKKIKVPRLVRMHSDEMEDVEELKSGEIGGVFGVECASGDTFWDGKGGAISMTSMYVPDPVISLSIKPKGGETPNFSRALNKFQREDPTFRVWIDSESKETIISGMGELHLEIYVERLKREWSIECITGRPRVAFRETITKLAEFNYTHKKQTGGAGQFGRVVGYIEPAVKEDEAAAAGLAAEEGVKEEKKGDESVFENRVMSGNVPIQYIPGVEKGFREALLKGSLTGNPVTNARFVLEDGAAHVVDSSELAFRMAAIGAFREAFKKAGAVVLEPIMDVEVVAPVEFQSNVIAGVNQRRGTILNSEIRQDEFTVTAEVALNDMFGYSGQLRGSTQGKGEFSMEYKKHAPVLPNVQKEMEEEYRKVLGIKK